MYNKVNVKNEYRQMLLTAVAKSRSKEVRKFILVLLVLLVYSAFAVHSYGLKQGLSVTVLTWSFFVFCTPIADAGFLLDFPIRLITGIKMLYSEIIVWVGALLLNAVYFSSNQEAYQKTDLLKLFHKIVTTPWPLWLIIVLSCIGTFASVVFDDSVYDVAVERKSSHHSQLAKKKLYLTAGIFVLTFVSYAALLHYTHVSIRIF